MADDNVRPLRLIQCRDDRPPPLSDAEIIQMRRMLQQFEILANGCPMARRLLEEE